MLHGCHPLRQGPAVGGSLDEPRAHGDDGRVLELVKYLEAGRKDAEDALSVGVYLSCLVGSRHCASFVLCPFSAISFLPTSPPSVKFFKTGHTCSASAGLLPVTTRARPGLLLRTWQGGKGFEALYEGRGSTVAKLLLISITQAYPVSTPEKPDPGRSTPGAWAEVGAGERAEGGEAGCGNRGGPVVHCSLWPSPPFVDDGGRCVP